MNLNFTATGTASGSASGKFKLHFTFKLKFKLKFNSKNSKPEFTLNSIQTLKHWQAVAAATGSTSTAMIGLAVLVVVP